MADEETPEIAEQQVEETSEQQAEEKDWKAEYDRRDSEYKAQQSSLQETTEKLNQLQETFDMLSPYIDYDRMQKPPETGEEDTLTREDLSKFSNQVQSELMQLKFRQKHPDLMEYEDTLVGPAVTRIRQANPRMPIEKVLDRAAEHTKKFIETERQRGVEEAEKRQKAAASTGGMGSAGTTTSKKEAVDEGESIEEYLARRKKASAKARGLI